MSGRRGIWHPLMADKIKGEIYYGKIVRKKRKL